MRKWLAQKKLALCARQGGFVWRGLRWSYCYYCGRLFIMAQLTFDHFRPRHIGGTWNDRNLVLACAPCNRKKGGDPAQMNPLPLPNGMLSESVIREAV